MPAIPMAMPLARSQPGAIHSTPDGRAWYGHGDRVNPDTGMFQEASLTLTSAPRQGDDLWIDANSITIPHAQPQPSGQPTWPTLDELDESVARLNVLLGRASSGYAAFARAKAETAISEAQLAIKQARLAIAVAEAAAAREQSDDTDEPQPQPDLSELDSLNHPSLSPAERNRR